MISSFRRAAIFSLGCALAAGVPAAPGRAAGPPVRSFARAPAASVPMAAHVSPFFMPLGSPSAVFNAALMRQAFLSPFAMNFNPYSRFTNSGLGYPGAGTAYSPYAGYGMMAIMGPYGGAGTSAGYGPGSYGGASYSNPSYSSGSGSPSPAYSGGTANGAGAPGGYGPKSQQQAPGATALATVLTASGVPNDGGKLSWPLGLRILPPAAETRELRQQIDALLQVAANQAANGPVNPLVSQEAVRAADKLHALLLKKGDRLAATTYDEAEQFLNKLGKGLKALQ